MPAGGRRFSDMEMLVGMEDKQVGTARSRAGSCVEFYNVKVSVLLLSCFWLSRERAQGGISGIVCNCGKCMPDWIMYISENIREFHRSLHRNTPECIFPFVAHTCCFSEELNTLSTLFLLCFWLSQRKLMTKLWNNPALQEENKICTIYCGPQVEKQLKMRA